MNSGDIESRKIKTFTQTGKENWVTEIGDFSLQIKDKEDNFFLSKSQILKTQFLSEKIQNLVFNIE